jgi:hypothetical protein
MEVQILKYTGPMESGEVIIRQEHPLSQWRKLKVYQGMSLEIGKDIPTKVAKNIMAMMSHSFAVETVVLDNLGEVKRCIELFLEGYQERLKEDASSVLPALTIEALINNMGEEALESIIRALVLSEKIKATPGEISKRILELEEPKVQKPKAKPKAKVKPKLVPKAMPKEKSKE